MIKVMNLINFIDNYYTNTK